MGSAAVFDEGSHEHGQGGDQQPRAALEHFNDAQTDKQGEQHKNQDGTGKFHRQTFYSNQAYAQAIQAPAIQAPPVGHTHLCF